MENQTTDLTLVPQQSETAVNFFTKDGFEHLQRLAKCFSSSKLVPTIYQGKEGIANCIIAMEMASRMQISPFLVMQQMELVHGRPCWRAKFKIGQLNASGRFQPLQYEWKDEGKKVVEYATYYDAQGNKKYQKHKHTLQNDKWCRAYTKDMNDKDVFGPWVSYSLAVSEGWWHRKGSKWASMPEKMLMYRAGSWFADVHDPGSGMGLKTVSEELEIGKVQVVKNDKLTELNKNAGKKKKIGEEIEPEIEEEDNEYV